MILVRQISFSLRKSPIVAYKRCVENRAEMQNPNDVRDRLLSIQRSLEAAKKPISILIVEDDENDAQILRMKLDSIGIPSMLTKSGEMATQRVQYTRFDIVFLDWKLLGKSGLSTLTDIKRNSPGTIVIVLTGYPNSDNIAAALETGAAAIMSKPITDEQLKLIFAVTP
jgi:DNA-binding NtrC family response regulator